MSRSALVLIGGSVLLGVGIVGGMFMFSATTAPDDSPPVATNPPAAVDYEPRPAPTGMFPSQRRADVLLPDDVPVGFDELVVYAEGNAWRVSPEMVEEWAAIGSLTAECMAEAGYWYDPRVPSTVLTAEGPPGFDEALGGSTGAGDAYRWEDAGCGGFVIHELGISD